jgi:DNA-binding MarR family transcriptional regulator
MRPYTTRLRVLRELLDGEQHTVADLIAATDASMASTYACLQRLVEDRWVERHPHQGRLPRRYSVTWAGRRAVAFQEALAGQPPEDDSRSSSPTAARSSS